MHHMGDWHSAFNFNSRKHCEHLSCSRKSVSHGTKQLWQGPFCGSTARAFPPGVGDTSGKKECHLSTIWIEGSERKREKPKATWGFLVWQQVRAGRLTKPAGGGLVGRGGPVSEEHLTQELLVERAQGSGQSGNSSICILSLRKVGFLKRLQTLHFTLFYRQIANLS